MKWFLLIFIGSIGLGLLFWFDGENQQRNTLDKESLLHPVHEDLPSPAQIPDTVKEPSNLMQRFTPPPGFERVSVASHSFGTYLRALPLKPKGSAVHYYNGQRKPNQVHVAVIDLDVGKRDLQQCADAVMRLRAEYLYQAKRFEEIQFHFTNGFLAAYKKWRDGYRIKVNGHRVSWYNAQKPDTTYLGFRRYLTQVFIYAGTLSLEKELEPISPSSLQIGDVFIQGGSPGHAVLVVDVAQNSHTNEKAFLLAQSYMPAQDIHILKNGMNPGKSPWYILDEDNRLATPEWTFEITDLKRFPEY